MSPSTLQRPAPHTLTRPRILPKGMPPKEAAQSLLRGDSFSIHCHYGRGAEILEQLARIHPAPAPTSDYATRMAFAQKHRNAERRLFAPIEDHRVALRDARSIGFLKELYPDTRSFWLPFPDVQELHGAWRKYQEGTHLAVLGHKIHPFYGTYVPTRVSHLELFGTWLSNYAGPRHRAVDVGTGCGVLAMMIAKSGFNHVVATDCNPNALESVRRDLKRREAVTSMNLLECDLLGTDPAPADLIVFNPPWLHGEIRSYLDQALFFNDNLFERFFEQAHRTITPNGRVVLVFSNIMQLLQPERPHPILQELETGRFHLVNKTQRRIKNASNGPGPRRRTKERVEIWELSLQDPLK